MKPFEEALFALKTGEVSGVVETRLGYHLIKAVDRKPEMTIPFENLKDRLRTLLKQEKGQQEANASMGKVREKAAVEIFLPAEEEEELISETAEWRPTHPVRRLPLPSGEGRGKA